jgi:hypothetical protein
MVELEPVKFRIDRVPAQVTYPLRQRVLRPGRPLTSVVLAGDDDPVTGSFAARDASGEVVGTATVRPEPCPWRPDEIDPAIGPHVAMWRPVELPLD